MSSRDSNPTLTVVARFVRETRDRSESPKPAHVALAWLIARPSITAPIASATSLAQLEDLFAGVRESVCA